MRPSSIIAALHWRVWVPLRDAGDRWPWVLLYWLARLLRSRRIACAAWRGLLRE